MKAEEDARVRTMLEETGALRSGHFLLSSGLHSDRYCQAAALFVHPGVGRKVADLMAKRLNRAGIDPDVVLAPALGGILWGYALAESLGVRSYFAERPAGEGFELRRGFALEKGEKVLLAEDVITTGKSVSELVPLVEAAGAEVIGYAAVADRSQGRFQPGPPVHALIELSFETYKPEDCPMCASGSVADKPGSRKM